MTATTAVPDATPDRHFPSLMPRKIEFRSTVARLGKTVNFAFQVFELNQQLQKSNGITATPEAGTTRRLVQRLELGLMTLQFFRTRPQHR